MFFLILKICLKTTKKISYGTKIDSSAGRAGAAEVSSRAALCA
jgi:hypothetical protein